MYKLGEIYSVVYEVYDDVYRRMIRLTTVVAAENAEQAAVTFHEAFTHGENIITVARQGTENSAFINTDL